MVECSNKQQQRSNRTRRQIIKAAREVFCRKGIVRTSLEDVALAAGMTRGAVYWHFKGKQELLLAVCQEAGAPLLQGASNILDGAADLADPLDAVEAALLAFAKVLLEVKHIRQAYEILFLRCADVDEYAAARAEIERSVLICRDKTAWVYRLAAQRGRLVESGNAVLLAQDTYFFFHGLLYQALLKPMKPQVLGEMQRVIAEHMRLRRRERLP